VRIINRKGGPRGDPGYRNWLRVCDQKPVSDHVPSLAIGGSMLANELLEYELKQSGLLDAKIAREIKFCSELKAIEEMRSKT
jgi:hypothetical protein